MSAPKITFSTRRLDDADVFDRMRRRAVTQVVSIHFVHVVTIKADDGSEHHGEGDTQPIALRRATDRWNAWECEK